MNFLKGFGLFIFGLLFLIVNPFSTLIWVGITEYQREKEATIKYEAEQAAICGTVVEKIVYHEPHHSRHSTTYQTNLFLLVKNKGGQIQRKEVSVEQYATYKIGDYFPSPN